VFKKKKCKIEVALSGSVSFYRFYIIDTAVVEAEIFFILNIEIVCLFPTENKTKLFQFRKLSYIRFLHKVGELVANFLFTFVVPIPGALHQGHIYGPTALRCSQARHSASLGSRKKIKKYVF
jgi:hypothetical protein